MASSLEPSSTTPISAARLLGGAGGGASRSWGRGGGGHDVGEATFASHSETVANASGAAALGAALGEDSPEIELECGALPSGAPGAADRRRSGSAGGWQVQLKAAYTSSLRPLTLVA